MHHPSSQSQGLLQRLGPIAAAAAIFLGGYGTGLASNNMYGDIQAAEQHSAVSTQALVAPQPGARGVSVRQTSLAMPDQVGHLYKVVCVVCVRALGWLYMQWQLRLGWQLCSGSLAVCMHGCA